jgi:hypothetical protein
VRRDLELSLFALPLALVGVLTGCGGAPLADAVMPNGGTEPTELAKCSVAASQDQPLVTEWPAPYKARLEAMLMQGVVAVEYSGCELKIVDRCKLPGSYAWTRTTLSTDATQIRDEDELYAKLPLGAFSLAGELKTRGQLEVQTTVVGQLRLVGKAADDITSGAECGRATHLVTALSIGAFKLAAGGEVSADAHAGVGSMGAGVGTSQSKTILREAGKSDACNATTDDAPNVDCRSPIQIFLSPIRRSVPLNILSPLPGEAP